MLNKKTFVHMEATRQYLHIYIFLLHSYILALVYILVFMCETIYVIIFIKETITSPPLVAPWLLTM